MVGSMLLNKNAYFYYDGSLRTISDHREVTTRLLGTRNSQISFITRRGYHLTMVAENRLSDKNGNAVCVQRGVVLSIAKPPSRKFCLFSKRLRLSEINALLSTRTTLQLTKRIHATFFWLWLRCIFVSLPLQDGKFQSLAWACGYHTKICRRGTRLTRRTPKYDKVSLVFSLEGDFVPTKRLSVRTTDKFYNYNSFKIKLR